MRAWPWSLPFVLCAGGSSCPPGLGLICCIPKAVHASSTKPDSGMAPHCFEASVSLFVNWKENLYLTHYKMQGSGLLLAARPPSPQPATEETEVSLPACTSQLERSSVQSEPETRLAVPLPHITQRAGIYLILIPKMSFEIS